MINKIYNSFCKRFKNKPVLIQSPGRINLIGEHTDYNDGFVLPAAIDKYIFFAVADNKTNNVNIFSFDFNDFVSFELTDIQRSDKNWANYIIGVINELQKSGKKIQGFDLVFGGNIPIGAGLSSSAALETGLAFGLNKIFNLGLSSLEIVKLSQKAENNFVGVNCGIMDQFAAVFGKEKNVFKLDCRTLEFEYFPFISDDYQLLLCNSNVKHSLVSSEYNKRRKQCETGVKILKNHYPSINKLRDVTLEILFKCKEEFDEDVFAKCSYVVEENERLIKACEDLNKNNLKLFGKRMYETHEGLKTKYDVSCKELDFLVDFTKNYDGVLGARMMGGGFGGCTINLVKKDFKDKMIELLSLKYKNIFNIDAEFYDIDIVGGTKII